MEDVEGLFGSASFFFPLSLMYFRDNKGDNNSMRGASFPKRSNRRTEQKWAKNVEVQDEEEEH